MQMQKGWCVSVCACVCCFFFVSEMSKSILPYVWLCPAYSLQIYTLCAPCTKSFNMLSQKTTRLMTIHTKIPFVYPFVSLFEFSIMTHNRHTFNIIQTMLPICKYWSWGIGSNRCLRVCVSCAFARWVCVRL